MSDHDPDALGRPRDAERDIAPRSLVHGVSVVVPVYHSTDSLRELVRRVADALGDVPYEVILTDDGSPESTWDVVQELARARPEVTGLRLGRNFGQHNALLAGVRAARYATTVTMDDDLQNPPEEIPLLLDALTDGVDVVYGTPRQVAQQPWRRAGSAGIRRILATALGARNAAQLSSFRAFRTQLRDAFDGDLGPSVSIDALLGWGTTRFTSVEVDHHDRSEGTSNYSLRSLFRFAIDVATGYSSAPLQFASAVGALTAVFGVGVLLWVLGRVVVTGVAVPGFAFLASIITIFAGAQLMSLGIIGEYLSRMHFRLMRKPSYVVAESTSENQDTL